MARVLIYDLSGFKYVLKTKLHTEIILTLLEGEHKLFL
jgi:hypothetical protein